MRFGPSCADRNPSIVSPQKSAGFSYLTSHVPSPATAAHQNPTRPNPIPMSAINTFPCSKTSSALRPIPACRRTSAWTGRVALRTAMQRGQGGQGVRRKSPRRDRRGQAFTLLENVATGDCAWRLHARADAKKADDDVGTTAWRSRTAPRYFPGDLRKSPHGSRISSKSHHPASTVFSRRAAEQARAAARSAWARVSPRSTGRRSSGR